MNQLWLESMTHFQTNRENPIFTTTIGDNELTAEAIRQTLCSYFSKNKTTFFLNFYCFLFKYSMKVEVSFLVSAAISSKISTFFFSVSTNTFSFSSLSSNRFSILSEIDSNLSRTIFLKLYLFFPCRLLGRTWCRGRTHWRYCWV